MLKRKDLRRINLEKKIAVHKSYVSEADKKNSLKNNIQKIEEEYTETQEPVIDETNLITEETTEVVTDNELTEDTIEEVSEDGEETSEETIEETEEEQPEVIEENNEEIKDKKN